MPRKLTAKGRRPDASNEENPGGPSINPRGPGTRGGKRKKTAADIGREGIYGSRTVVAANPFDDDMHQASPASNLGKPQIGNIHSPAPPPIHSNYVPMPPSYIQQPPMHPRLISTPPHHFVDGPSPLQQTNPPGPPMPVSQPHYMSYPARSQDYGVMSPPIMQPNHLIDQQPPQQPPSTQMRVGQFSPVLICGRCTQEIYQNHPRIKCEAFCQGYYHQGCSGLTDMAFDLLRRESYAEWVCDGCMSSGKQILLVRYKQPEYGPPSVYA